jgi:C4-dicarboxylate-specific signal transduction histidine kinase
MAHLPKGRYKIMTLNIQNASFINAEGTKTNRNCRVVFCITTNTFYASVGAAAKAIGVTSGAISWVLTKRMKTVKGLRFCYADEILEFMQEIAATNRANAEKARLYDEMIVKQNKRNQLHEQISKHDARIEELEAEKQNEIALRDQARKELEALISEI